MRKNLTDRLDLAERAERRARLSAWIDIATLVLLILTLTILIFR